MNRKKNVIKKQNFFREVLIMGSCKSELTIIQATFK